MVDGVSHVSLCSENNICQELARHDSGQNQASLPSAACICCLCIPCILPEQKKRLASTDISSTRWSQKQALSGQVVLSLSLLEVTLCQSGNKSELIAAGDRQSDAELMNFFVPKYKNNIWAVNIFVLRSKLFHLGTIIRLTSDLSGTDRTALGGPKAKYLCSLSQTVYFSFIIYWVKISPYHNIPKSGFSLQKIISAWSE